MIFRFRYLVQGGHTHVRVFAGTSEGALGKCGDLCFRNEEFVTLRALIEAPPTIQILEEDSGYFLDQD